MVRTLRKDCQSCGKPGFYVEGRRRTSCFYCGKPIVLPASRGQVLVDFTCPLCATVSEAGDTASVASCPGCRASFALIHDGALPRLCVRDRVSRARAVKIAEQRGRGSIEEATLYFVPYWLYQAAELGWVLGNETIAEVGSRKRRVVDPAREAPSREIVAPVGGKLEYTKKETSRAVREYLADPVGEPFGWKAFAKHTEGEILAPFDGGEAEAPARVLGAAWTRDEALAEATKRAQARELVDERQMYRFFEHRVLLREALSLVYHPFWVLFFDPPDVPGRESIPRDWMVIDAVAGDVTREPQAGGPALFRLAVTDPPARATRAMPLRCPSCEAAFERAESAAILVCPSCLAPLEMSAQGLTRVEARFVKPHDAAGDASAGGDDLVYVPVWRYRVKVRGERKEMANRAQWKRFTRPLDATPKPGDNKRSIVFYSLAAGAPGAARLDSLSLSLTRLQPDLEFAPPVVRRALPVAYSAADARRLTFSTYLTLFRDLTLKSIDGLKRTQITAEPPELIFYPCVSRRGEIRDPRMGVTIQMGSSWSPGGSAETPALRARPSSS